MQFLGHLRKAVNNLSSYDEVVAACVPHNEELRLIGEKWVAHASDAATHTELCRYATMECVKEIVIAGVMLQGAWNLLRMGKRNYGH